MAKNGEGLGTHIAHDLTRGGCRRGGGGCSTTNTYVHNKPESEFLIGQAEY